MVDSIFVEIGFDEFEDEFDNLFVLGVREDLGDGVLARDDIAGPLEEF